MFFIPLVLGALAMQLPFVAVLLLWLYFSRVAVTGMQQPIKVLGAFFVIPVLMVLIDPGSSSALPGLDAILGVGVPSLIFLVALARNMRTTTAYAASATSLIVYGTARAVIFRDLLASIQNEANTQLQALMPNLMDQEIYTHYLGIMNLLMPGIWIAIQVVAMLIALMIFHKQLKLPFLWTKIQFPWQYNLLIVAVIPLYFYAPMHHVLVTAILGLSILPCIQGISLIVNYLTRAIYNKILRVILLIALLINSISLIFIALLGFTDIWFNFRKIHTEGSPA